MDSILKLMHENIIISQVITLSIGYFVLKGWGSIVNRLKKGEEKTLEDAIKPILETHRKTQESYIQQFSTSLGREVGEIKESVRDIQTDVKDNHKQFIDHIMKKSPV